MTSALRSSYTNVEIAKRFGAFCKEAGIVTRGIVKVGMTPRGLRGVVATKAIPVNETVIVVPDKAFMTAFDALRNKDFVDNVCGGEFPLQVDDLRARIMGGFLYVHHVLLAYYMADTLLLGDHIDSTPLSESLSPIEKELKLTPNGGFNRYVDFLPRSEGNFQELRGILERTLRTWQLNEDLEGNLGARHRISREDAREVVLWAIMMVLSRSLPIEHKGTLERIFAKTDFLSLLEKEPTETQYSIPVMCPLLDMVNHSNQNENVVVMVPEDGMREMRPIVARALRPIAAGEEVTMRYGMTDPYGLKVFYGMEDIFP
eukprot:CAMPEP_0174829430 /NCGR_PEP_ID=MMETSP1114-20130205/1924_1 /TAXON_ID=312471 /ORGANISM="Neobodo designis, Strain CCAP 1951/1" /LENGTH=315 /DNA_ID=CAMNT_0016063177 /DNA_START=30 /DNA_END=977 /DNA_ORIENTATION=-